MASSVYFNGRVTQIPGSYSEIDASGLNVIGLSATGIVACIGEAEGGKPNFIYAISNPAKVQRVFRDGDLREAASLLFDPSKDPQIPGGAQEIKFVKVNPATQSSATFQNGDGDALVVTSADYGLFTTQINLEIADGTNQGKAITITYGSIVEEFDDVGGIPALVTQYTPGSNGASTMLIALDPLVGVESTFTLARDGLTADYPGTTNAITGLLADKTNNITPGNTVVVLSASAGDTTQSVLVIGESGGTPVTETIALNGTTPVAGAQVFDTVHGFVILGSTPGAGNITVRDGVTPLFTITAGSLSSGGGCYTFAADYLEVDNDTLSIVASGATTADIIVVGRNPVPASIAERVTLNGTTPVVTTAKWSEIRYVALGYLSGSRSITISALALNSGDTVTIVSSNVGDTTQSAYIYGLDESGDPQLEILALNGTTDVVGTATWSQVHGMALSAAALGTVTLNGASEDVLIFSLAAADLYAGYYPVENVAVAGEVIDYTSETSLTDRTAIVIGIDGAGAAAMEKITIDGASHSTTGSWLKITAIAISHVQATRTVTISGSNINMPISAYSTIQQVADKINATLGWVATIGPNAGPLLIADLDTLVATDATAEVDFSADLAFIVSAINSQSQLVTAEAASGATGAPVNTSSPVYLVGGIEGTTLFSHWQAALDLLRDEFVNTIVVLTSDAAVHAAVVAHCQYMAGAGRRERDCVLGTVSGIDFSDAKDAAVELNTRHARLCIQDVERFNVSGVREQFPPYFAGCLIAGMQAGSGVGLPLTFKYANVLDVIGDDASYTIRDDANELIDSGLLVFEKVPGIGFRVLRNITTYLIDDNLAYTEGSVNQAVNVAVYNLRTRLEAAVGRKGFTGTLNATLGIAVSILNQLIDEEILVSWQNLTIELTADVMRVDVEIAPILPVNFVLTTVHLVTASLSAAA